MMSMMEMYPELVRQLHEDRVARLRRERARPDVDERPVRRRRGA